MIQSVGKAIDILQIFSPEEPRLSLAEISARLDLPKSTAHNLLNTMAARGFIEKTGDGLYALGTQILTLTQSVRINVELRDVASPLLRSLADATRESVYLAVHDGDYCLYIYAVESPHRLRARTAVGDRTHLHCTGVGKAILSHLPRTDVQRIVDSVGLPRFTAHTITEPADLWVALEQIQARGYAVDDAEHEEGTYCISAPILNRLGRSIAACSVAGGKPELLQSLCAKIARQVTHTAEEISRYMGYVPTRTNVVTPQPDRTNQDRTNHPIPHER